MATATLSRKETPRDLTDDEALALNDIEAAEEEELELERVFKPGEKVFDMGDGTQEGRFEGTMTGSDPSLVNIYDRDGRAMPMTRDLAKVRLRKRYPANHPFVGERVFYMKPPRAFPIASFFCLSTRTPPCRKRFQTKQQQEKHFQNRHGDEWAETERNRGREREERMIELQEAQVASSHAMTAILVRMAAGESVSPADAAQALAGTPGPIAKYKYEEPPAQPFPEGLPVKEWRVAEIQAWVEHHEFEKPKENTFVWNKGKWLDYVDRLLAEGR
jgi:hypothetical protein